MVELTVSMLLVVIMLAITFPVFNRSLAKSNLYAAARQISGHIRETQQMAMTEQDTYHLLFDLKKQGGYYRIKDGMVTIKKCALPFNVTVTNTNFSTAADNKYKLFFGPNGRPVRGGTVTLKNTNGDFLYVIVAVHSGRVRVDDKPPAGKEIQAQRKTRVSIAGSFNRIPDFRIGPYTDGKVLFNQCHPDGKC